MKKKIYLVLVLAFIQSFAFSQIEDSCAIKNYNFVDLKFKHFFSKDDIDSSMLNIVFLFMVDSIGKIKKVRCLANSGINKCKIRSFIKYLSKEKDVFCLYNIGNVDPLLFDRNSNSYYCQLIYPKHKGR